MRAFVIWLSVLMGLGAHAAAADDYPTRPVKMIIPFPAGAGTDLTGRLVADELGKRLHQQFVVENKPGAAAQLGTDFVAKSDPDGYTLLWTVSDGLSVLPAVKSLPYNVPDDFAFIGSIAQQPYTFAVSIKRDFKTFAELVAYAKSHPDGLNYGSAGPGSAPHLTIAMIAAEAGIQMVHVPFAGLAPSTNALVAGTVDVGLTIPVQAKELIAAGSIRALAVTGDKRSRLLPDVPTLRQRNGGDLLRPLGAGQNQSAGRRPLAADAERHDARSGFHRSPLCARLRSAAVDRRRLSRLHRQGFGQMARRRQGGKH
jgi:tripartite-type tricarboxylate transporter receptor subunit TctC